MCVCVVKTTKIITSMNISSTKLKSSTRKRAIRVCAEAECTSFFFTQ